MSKFARYIGVDYSGAQTPTSSLKGLKLYSAIEKQLPQEVPPTPSQRKYWTRRGVAEWLNEILSQGIPTLVGIDHAFSFPLAYFDQHAIEHDWDVFLEDFCAHWPTNEDHMYVDFVRNGSYGKGALRTGDRRWRRLTEKKSRTAKSVFHFDVQGSVAKSTHSGLPWLQYLRRERGKAIHFWPFDGWNVNEGMHTIVEVYPSLWRDLYPFEGRTSDQQDAYAVCRWMMEKDSAGELTSFFTPTLSPEEKALGKFEGWILGVIE